MSSFRNELEDLINKFNKEDVSDTPDFILTQFLEDSLKAFDNAVIARREWHSRENTENWMDK